MPAGSWRSSSRIGSPGPPSTEPPWVAPSPALLGCFVTDVYAAGEAPIPGVTGRVVADAAGAAGAEVGYVPRRVDLAGVVAAEARPGDLVLLMGAGDITLVADELSPLLARG